MKKKSNTRKLVLIAAVLAILVVIAVPALTLPAGRMSWYESRTKVPFTGTPGPDSVSLVAAHRGPR